MKNGSNLAKVFAAYQNVELEAKEKNDNIDGCPSRGDSFDDGMG